MIDCKYFFILALLMCLAGGCDPTGSVPEIPPVRNFDAARYMGRWYEIARLPHWFERDLSNPTADYTLLPDGRIKVVNCGWRNGLKQCVQGRAELLTAGIGELSVSFQWPFNGRYRIIYLSEDYQTAIVTANSRDYLWILSRRPDLSRSELIHCLGIIKKRGFAAELLQYPTDGVTQWLR